MKKKYKYDWSFKVHQSHLEQHDNARFEGEIVCGGAFSARPFQLPRVIILIESYDELSAAADRGVGELRLMTLGNQSSS